MFGELVGLWLAQVWADQGRPDPFILAELGPGRGTLMRDALRAAARQPGFRAAARLWLVETSPALRAAPGRTPSPTRAPWADRAGDLPARPAPPRRQRVLRRPADPPVPARRRPLARAPRRPRRLRCWAAAAPRRRPRRPLPRPPRRRRRRGLPRRREAIAAALGARIARHGGAALLIDYGAWDGSGDTLQAVAGHAPADPLAAPGEADLTAHVRFRALAEAARPARAFGTAGAGRLPRAPRHHRPRPGAGPRPAGRRRRRRSPPRIAA